MNGEREGERERDKSICKSYDQAKFYWFVWIVAIILTIFKYINAISFIVCNIDLSSFKELFLCVNDLSWFNIIVYKQNRNENFNEC